MKKIYVLILLAFFSISSLQSQVTQIYTDYNNFWTSSSTAINSVKPDLSHNVLAFRSNGTVYATGVDNAKLTANGVTFTPTSFRALPINSVPLTGSTSYFIGFGQLADGLHNAVNNGPTIPFAPITTGAQKAAFLTDGIHGLNLGTCLTNIPGTLQTFNLSLNGITLSNVGDGSPDIMVSQIAQPTSTADELYFVQADGTTQVGTKLLINMSNNTAYPTVGNWLVDLYFNNSTQNDPNFINTERTLKFFAADLSQFGINATNYQLARKLIYKPSGDSDPAFIAYNEPSMGVAQQLVVTAQPTTSNCNGTMPSGFSVRLADGFANGFVEQSGYIITASMYSGPGALLGTLTATTDATGTATFSNLSFEVGGDHIIKFSNTSLRDGVTATISGPNCADNTWTGNISTAWNNTGNWATAIIPNANNNVTIPAGRPRYPVLTANAGAKDLILGAGAIINLNGHLFTVKGNITKDATAYVQGSTAASELYMSGSTLQTIPAGFVNGDLANFTVENAAGVTTNAILRVTNLLRVEQGNLNANGNITMACSFSPRKTGIIGRLVGTISGEVTTEQCFPARRAFRLISPSVTTTTSIRANWQENANAWNHNPNPGYGTQITGIGASGSNASITDGINGFDWQPSGASSLFLYSNTTQAWSAATSTLGTLTAGSPYRLMVRGSRSTDITSNAAVPTNTKLRTKGTIVQGDVPVSGLSSTAGQYNLVGNPYHSVVDMSAVIGASHNLTNFYYIWDPKMGGTNPTVGQPGGRGAFVAVNTTTGVKSNTSSDASQYLQPYQAFFVRTGTLGGTPMLMFQENYKVTSTTQTNVFRMAVNPSITMSLFYDEAVSEENTATDGLRIDFTPGANNEFDADDAPKFGNLDENLSRSNGGSNVSLENRDLPVAGEELPLVITQYRKTNYTMNIEAAHFDGINVYLKDYYLNQQTLLNQEGITNVNFTVDTAIPASTESGRFSLLFEESLNVNEVATNAFSLYPNPATGDLVYINGKLPFTAADITIYNMVGQAVQNAKAIVTGSNQVSVNVNQLPSGVYILTVKTDSGIVSSLKFIKK